MGWRREGRQGLRETAARDDTVKNIPVPPPHPPPLISPPSSLHTQPHTHCHHFHIGRPVRFKMTLQLGPVKSHLHYQHETSQLDITLTKPRHDGEDHENLNCRDKCYSEISFQVFMASQTHLNESLMLVISGLESRPTRISRLVW